MTSRLPTQCASCAHLRRNGFSCPAYPDRIPDEILVWAGDHRRVRDDQVGETVLRVKDKRAFEAWQSVYAD